MKGIDVNLNPSGEQIETNEMRENSVTKLPQAQEPVTPGRSHLVHGYKRALLLNDQEIFVTMLKFMIGIGIFNRPMLYKNAGLVSSIIVEIIGTTFSVMSNLAMVSAIMFMPAQLTTAEEKLTYGKVVHYVLDDRENRIKGGFAYRESSRFW